MSLRTLIHARPVALALLIGVTPSLAGCVPSRADLFRPVEQAVAERTGTTPEWHSSLQASASAQKRVRELLAEPLTAEHASAIAILNSPELQASYAELGVAGAELGNASVLRNPELDAELAYPLDGRAPYVEFRAIEDVTQLISLFLRKGRAEAELQAERRRAVERTVELSGRARIAFFEAVAAEQRRHLREVIVATASASAELARRLQAAGNMIDLDRTREEVFEEEAKVALRQAQSAAATSREGLNRLLGLRDKQTGWHIPPELPGPPDAALPNEPAHLEHDAIAASLELEALRWNIEAAGKAIGLARFESVVPQLGVGVAVRREGDWAVGPAVALSLPLLDFGEGKRAAAWARLEGLRHRYAAATLETRAVAREAIERLHAAREQVERMRTRVVPLRKMLLEQAVRQYTAMTLDAFRLLVIRREQAEAEERYIDALLSYWSATSDIEQLRRGSLPRGHNTERPPERSGRGLETGMQSEGHGP